MSDKLSGRLTPERRLDGTLNNKGTLRGVLGGTGAVVKYASLPDKPSINGVTLVGNKTTSDLNINYNDLKNLPSIPDVGEIDERLDNLEGNITSLGGRVTTAEGNITTLQGDTSALDTRLTTAEGNITSLGGRVTSNEGDISDLQGDTSALGTRLTTAEENITSLGGRVTTAEGNITSLGGRVTTAEGNITTLQGDTSALDTRLTTAEGNITSLDGRVTTNEGNISDLQGDMSQAQSDISELNTSLTPEKFTVTAGENITIAMQKCYKIGKLAVLKITAKATQNITGSNKIIINFPSGIRALQDGAVFISGQGSQWGISNFVYTYLTTNGIIAGNLTANTFIHIDTTFVIA